MKKRTYADMCKADYKVVTIRMDTRDGLLSGQRDLHNLFIDNTMGVESVTARIRQYLIDQLHSNPGAV